MEFASKYVFKYADSDEESVSDDEFKNGMDVSDSDSGEESSSTFNPALQRQMNSSSKVASDGKKSQPKSKSVFGRLFGNKDTVKSKSTDEPDHHHRSVSHWKRSSYAPEKRLAVHRSCPAATNRRRFRRADTNVVSIKFEKLTQPSHMHTGDPVYCARCKAILSRISQLQDDGTEKLWSCEFCGEENHVDIMEEEIPQMDDVTFMLEPAVSTTASGPTGMDESLVVFCVDTSGSMCVTTEVPGRFNLRGNHLADLQSLNTGHEDQHLPGERRNVTYISRLQSMQAAVDHQIKELLKDFPHRRVALIAFNNEVEVHGDGSQAPVCVSGDKLSDKVALKKIGSELAMPQAVNQSHATLTQKVYGLGEGGGTALGPALTVAVSMAAVHTGSKVIVCTDGMANVGLGSLENVSSNEQQETVVDFYTELGETALTNSLSISVVSITGSDCKLAQLGQVAQISGGQVNMVDPLKLTEEFSTILADKIIATKVVATFLLNDALYIRNEEEEESKVVRTIGNVSAETEVTFEYGVKKQKRKSSVPQSSNQAGAEANTEEGSSVDEGASTSSGAQATGLQDKKEEPQEYPFQLQIEYTDTEGARALRVFTQKKPATTERQTAEQEINLHVLGKHTAQASAKMAVAGDYSGSRGVALMQQRLAWRHGQKDNTKRHEYMSYFNKVKSVENKVTDMQQSELAIHGRTYSDEEDEEGLDEVDQSKSKKKLKKKKVKLQRMGNLTDSYATDMYSNLR